MLCKIIFSTKRIASGSKIGKWQHNVATEMKNLFMIYSKQPQRFRVTTYNKLQRKIWNYLQWSINEQRHEIPQQKWHDTCSSYTNSQIQHGRWKEGAGSVNFEIWYFPTKFFVKRVVFLVSDGQKWNFITFHHWITLFGYPWNKSFRRPWDAGKHDKALSSMAVSLCFLKIQNQIRWKGIICPFPFLFFKSEPTWKSSN